MLLHLKIENYALINKLEINFSEGFSVITGETGAGKSIIIGAMSLMLGQRADTQVLSDKNKKCIIEGSFNIKGYDLDSFFTANNIDFEETTIIRREIIPGGKSRAFVNDTPVNLDVIRELGNRLVNIHSQHQTLTLKESSFQLDVVDSYVRHQKLVQDYRARYLAYIKIKSELNELVEKEKQSQADKDYYQFQFEELENSNLSEGEQEEAEKEIEVLNHSEEIKRNLQQAVSILEESDLSLLSRLSMIRNLIHNYTSYHDSIESISKRLEAGYIELKDISKEIENTEQKITCSPEKIQKLNDRLDLIYSLQHKHRVNSVKELLELKEILSEKLHSISSLDERISVLKKELSVQYESLKKTAAVISKSRVSAVPKIEKELVNTLKQLAINEAEVKIEHTVLEDININGVDVVRFLFNANKGGELKELSKVASGGELSRLMLSIKSLISQRNLLPTIIFDEIDIGISGDVANKMGNILKDMSEQMQLIAITHLPQIAGKADEHYLVYKETSGKTTKSFIKKLDKEERVNEIAKMISGNKPSESAIKTSKELLN